MRAGTVIAHESYAHHSHLVTDLFFGVGLEWQRRFRVELIADTGQHFTLAGTAAF